MAVSARFYVSKVAQQASGNGTVEGGEITLSPAYANGKNADWAKFTPSGSIVLNVNGPAFPWFRDHLGKDVAITFDDVPAED